MRMFITVDGIKIRYQMAGAGPDVLLLHGWGGKWESLAPVLNALCGDFRVTAIDFPAHGQSDTPSDIWGVDAFADHTLKLIDALGIAPCHVIAHSFGVRVTILMAAQHPEKFGKLVFTGGAGLLPPPTVKSRLRAAAYSVFNRFATDQLRDKLRDYFSSADYRALPTRQLKQMFVKVVNFDERAYLSRIQSPTLLIWGREDTATPLRDGQIMEKEIPNAGLVVFDDCGHFAYLERSGEFNKIARHFLINP
jgi:pimeloyl-ACP methyl ester carboxylesterase